MPPCNSSPRENLSSQSVMSVDNGQPSLRLPRMRGRFAAACAAVLVGLSPAGALPFAAYAVSVAQRSGDTIRNSLCQVAPAQAVGTELRIVSPELEVPAFANATTAIWRAPSGPAPSRAPPAAV